MVGGTGRKGVRVRRLAVTDRGDEPVFIVGLFCIPFFIDGKGVVKEAVFVLELDVMIYFESGSPFFYRGVFRRCSFAFPETLIL